MFVCVRVRAGCVWGGGGKVDAMKFPFLTNTLQVKRPIYVQKRPVKSEKDVFVCKDLGMIDP